MHDRVQLALLLLFGQGCMSKVVGGFGVLQGISMRSIRLLLSSELIKYAVEAEVKSLRVWLERWPLSSTRRLGVERRAVKQS